MKRGGINPMIFLDCPGLGVIGIVYFLLKINRGMRFY